MNNYRMHSTALAVAVIAVGLLAVAGDTSPRCPEGYTPLEGSCYMVVATPSTLAEGALTCDLSGGRLASVESQEEQDVLADVLSTTVWIGATDAAEEGTFTNDGETPLEFSSWFYGEPNDSNESEDCVVLNEIIGYSWNDRNCDEIISTLCEADPAVDDREYTCPEGFKQFRDSCYLASEEPGTYDQGNDFCLENGAKPAFITSQEEQDFVATAVNETVFIGVTDRADEGNFVNDQYGSALYTSWSSWEPNNFFGEDCTLLVDDDNMQWNDDGCNTNEKTLCEVAGTPVPRYVCPEGYSQFDDTLCYYAPEDTTGTYSEAVAYCSGRGMTIAGVHNEEQQEFLTEVVSEDSWIGYSDIEDEGTFTWRDATVSEDGEEFTNWAWLEPNNWFFREDCVEMQASGPYEWNDKNCETKLSFVCQGPTIEE